MTALAGLFAIIVMLWLVQLVAAHVQAKKFMAAVNKLRGPGTTTAVGVAGTGWGKPRAYVALSCVRGDTDPCVRGAVSLHGLTVLARPREVPALADQRLAGVAEYQGRDGVNQAAAMAARTILDAKQDTGTTERGVHGTGR